MDREDDAATVNINRLLKHVEENEFLVLTYLKLIFYSIAG